MKNICFLCLLIFFCSCRKEKPDSEFHLLNDIPLIENGFTKRIFKENLYQIDKSSEIPEYVDKIYQLKHQNNKIYFNDTHSIFSYEEGEFEKVFTPSKGRGPNEVPQVFRFDIKDNLIAISGYPEMRLLIHDLLQDSSYLIKTEYRGNVIIDKNHNVYGENISNQSSFMFRKFNFSGDSLASFGTYFDNQNMSMDMFDLYWDYNQKHDLIVIGFMYAGYYIVTDTSGNIKYVIESFENGGNLPAIVQTDMYRYVDFGGKITLSGLSSYEDEVHIYSADAKNKDDEVYGAIIDVFDILSGQYKYSYLIEEKLHWPILLMDNYRLASVTEDYRLIVWKRKQTNL